MKKFDELSKIKKTEGATGPYKDPDSKLRRKQIAERSHKNMMIFLAWVPWLVGIFLLFLILLFIFILPLAEMTLDYDGFWDAVQDWARAFAITSRTLGAAIVTLAIPSVLKFAYVLVKSHSQSETNSMDDFSG